ncbi:cell division protein FtsQ/DivIB [Yoonia litorea]|uniref:Cell division protein FtsQ n=1 Tax=Yoonia litorea TaxID=1123755 RepID=A0A1I6MFK2_9RHOB|nr:cell division protein FtsQ/DivIB [Yoonia litorea]SFS14412.1 cell division protein FtsQ [Yoonia litorea]
MRPLIRRDTPSAPSRDPAPSRFGYRLQRLMLTPGFRGTVRIGVPLLLIGAIAGSWYSKPENRIFLSQTIAEAQRDFQERPQFMVRGSRIEGGGAEVTEIVSAFLPDAYPLSSFDMDLDAIRVEIEALDPIKSASVRVGQNGLLEVDLTPRVPVAVWRDGQDLRLIDAAGVVSGQISARSERSDLPLIAGEGAEAEIAEALQLFATAGPLLQRVRGLVRMGERRWDLVLDGNLRILLPDRGAQRALDRVLALDAARDMLSRDIAVVDMRNPARLTLRLNEEAAIALRRISSGNENNNEVGN